MTAQKDQTPLGVLLVVLSAVAFSTAGLFTRLVALDTWTVLFWRGLFGGLFIAGYVVWRHRTRTFAAIRAIGWIGVVAAACSTMATICFINALRLTSVADVMVIGATAPFVTAALAWLWTGERESPVTLVAGVMALIGVALMFNTAMPADHLLGSLLALAMTVLMSAMMVIIRHRRQTPMLPAAGLSAFAVALAVLPVARPGAVTGVDMVYLLLFGTTQFGLGLLLMTLGTRLISAARSALIGALDTPLAPLWVWLAFGEIPRLMTCAGGAVVMAAVTADVLLRKPAGRSAGACRPSATRAARRDDGSCRPRRWTAASICGILFSSAGRRGVDKAPAISGPGARDPARGGIMATEPGAGAGDAVVMRQYGPPSVLRLETVALPALAPDEIRVRSLVSAVNHSDLEIRAGNWPIRGNRFPYVPGLEVVGDVVEVGAAVVDFRVGDRVTTMMQGLGGVRAERPGGYAAYVTVPAAAAAPVPADLDAQEIAALGLAAVTAFEGLRKLGALAGRRVAVTGAAGGVGSAAIGVARAQGATVVAIVSRAAQADYVRSLGATDVFAPDDVAGGALGEATLDGILDGVAGASFGACVAALRPGATLCLVGSVAGHQVAFDTDHLYNVTLTGYSTESLDGPGLRRAMAAISGYLRRGALVPPARTVFPLAEAAAAHAALERHGVQGRLLLVPTRA